MLMLRQAHKSAAADIRVFRLAEGAVRNIANFVTGNADVRQGLVRQAAQFCKRTAVADPALCNTNRVHNILFGHLACLHFR